MKTQITHKYYKNNEKKLLNQCDILQDISIPIATDWLPEPKPYEITVYNLRYGIIINQDCDLERDYENRFDPKAKNQDKYIPNILILPAYLSEEFKNGNHRGEALKGNSWGTDQFKQIKSNLHIRFHFIEKDDNLHVPDLIIDFKHIYSLYTAIAYKLINEIYYVSISELFRENISNRYAHYLGRIGLPTIN